MTAPRTKTPPLSVAPMMEHTDRHLRFLLRLISRHTLLYTEMVSSSSLVHGDRSRLLDFDPAELPVALQLGGDDPEELALCARWGARWGYSEINLNVGCPSDRVQRGRMGAALMAEPELIARCVAAMREAVDLPVTVKHRIGIDEADRYEDLLHFVDTVAEAGADRFTVHARKAWLTGLSPRQNRSIPPLRYPDVHRLKAERPHLQIEINGGIRTLDQVAEQLERVDGVMMGRAVVADPLLLARADERFFGGEPSVTSPAELVAAMARYIDDRPDVRPGHVARHMLDLFHGRPGARSWRQYLSRLGPQATDSRFLWEAAESLVEGVPLPRA